MSVWILRTKSFSRLNYIHHHISNYRFSHLLYFHRVLVDIIGITKLPLGNWNQMLFTTCGCSLKPFRFPPCSLYLAHMVKILFDLVGSQPVHSLARKVRTFIYIIHPYFKMVKLAAGQYHLQLHSV